MRCEQSCSRAARFVEGSLEAAGQTHKASQSESERMSGLPWIRIVVGQLDARDDYETVLSRCALGLLLDRFQVRAVGRRDDRGGGSPDGIVGANDVVGDREDVETGAPWRSTSSRIVLPLRVSARSGSLSRQLLTLRPRASRAENRTPLFPPAAGRSLGTDDLRHVRPCSRFERVATVRRICCSTGTGGEELW